MTTLLGIGIAACGAPDLPDHGREVLGPKVEVVTSDPEPWVLEWDGDVRSAVTSELLSNILVVRYTDGALQLLGDCAVPGSYTGGGATSRPRHTETITSENEMYAKLDITIAEASAGFEKGETWKLDYVVADIRTADTLVTGADLPAGCDGATHFVRQAYYGAYVLDTGAAVAVDGSAGAVVNGVGGATGGGHKAGHGLTRTDGDLEACATADTPSDDPACRGLLKLGLEAI